MPDTNDGYDFHRNVLTMILDEVGTWEARRAKAAEIVEKMAKAGLLTPKATRTRVAKSEIAA